MSFCTSPYCESSILLYNNAVKSLLFACAALLAGLMVQSLFSLAAARANRFGPLVMFEQGLRQRALFVFSAKFFTLGRFLVLTYSVFYLMAGFYGTMLWSLDAPGYVLRESSKALTDFAHPLLDQRDYIITVTATPTNLASLEHDLARRFSVNLVDLGLNITLAGTVAQGQPRVVSPTQPGIAARIWLDPEGFSVSPDSSFMLMTKTTENGTLVGLRSCDSQPLKGTEMWYWNCTFDNTFAQQQLSTVAVRPEVHWDDESDLAYDSRYIRPNRLDNLWASYGQGVGTAVMKQVFTVTKSNRRHTFLQTVLRSTMLATAVSRFPTSEIIDFLRRSYTTNTTTQDLPIFTLLTRSILLAQSQNTSFTFGFTEGRSNLSTTQTAWEYLTAESNRLPLYSTLRFSTTTITLLHSETLTHIPAPLITTCAANFMNLAYGGQPPSDTDCYVGESDIPAVSSKKPQTAPRFFGQVDTSAVVIITGLGDGRSDRSATALDQTVMEWVSSPSVDRRINELLAARAFAVSVDPRMVVVTLAEAMAAASWLQMTFVIAVAVLAPLAAVALSRWAGDPWGHTLLWNLVVGLRGPEPRVWEGRGFWGWLVRLMLGGDLLRMPDLGLRVDPETGVGVVEIEGTAVVLEEKKQSLVLGGEEQPLVLGKKNGPAVLVQEENPIVVGSDGNAVEVKPSS